MQTLLDDPPIAELMAGLGAQQPSLKYASLKALRSLSETQPLALYPQFDHFIALLDSDNRILQWGAILILAELASVDYQGKIGPLLERYLQPISGGVMITAANVIKGAATIALAQPRLTPRIVQSLLTVERQQYQTPECSNVAIGHAVEAFDRIFEQIEKPEAVLQFVRRQLEDPRQAVQKKAAAFLKKHA